MTVENIENVENVTDTNTQPSSWFGHTAQPQEKKEPNKPSEQKLDTALEQKQEAPKEEKKVETNNFEKRYLDTRKAFQKTKNKIIYC